MVNEVKILYSGILCSINQKFINRRYVVSKKYRDSKESISWYAKQAMRGESPMTGDVRVEINLKLKRDADIDAFVKIVLDSCNSIIYLDDKQIKELVITKEVDKKAKEPYFALITISCLGGIRI